MPARNAFENLATEPKQDQIIAEIQSGVMVHQGTAGGTAWPVDIQGATVDVSQLQQLTINTDIDETAYDLNAALFTQTVNYATETLLGELLLKFSSAASRDITVTLDGKNLVALSAETAADINIDFEDLAVDNGGQVVVTISQTGSACTVDIALTSKVGSSALAGNPILGAGTAKIGSVDIEVSDSVAGDAFSRLRVSEPHSEFEVHHQYDLNTFLVGQTVDSTGTVVHNPPAARLLVDPGELVKHRSHVYVIYQAGKARLVRITAVFPENNDDAVRTIGYGDDDDGIFLVREVSGWSVLLRSSTVGDISVPQIDWNDPLDGTGPSGIVLQDWGPVHFVVDFEWLSIGRIRWGLEVGGRTRYFHEMDFANQIEFPFSYNRTGSLPVSWEIDATAVSSSSTSSEALYMDAVCASVITEGGHEPSGFIWSGYNDSMVSVGLSLTPLLAIRPRATFNGFQNNGIIYPKSITVLADANMMILVIFGGTLPESGWTKVDTNTDEAPDGNSHTEFLRAPFSLSGGVVIGAFPVGSGVGQTAGSITGEISKDVLISRAADGTLRPITICAQRLAGAGSAAATVQWIETR
ncbi:MAG: hypothetical protein ACU843_15480 [Gammaproteobacteria bacterium]